MKRDEHKAFIKSRLFEMMQEAFCVINQLGDGMEFYAASNYLLHSVFLQMTGAQEQKMKCICWELATDNLKYRYERYYKGWSLNQCSTLEDKCHVYEDLVKHIKSKDCLYKIFADTAAKVAFRDKILRDMNNLFEKTNIAKLYQKNYEAFNGMFSVMSVGNITPSEKLLFKKGNKDNPVYGADTDTELFAVYSLLYEHRNRCAHNTLSYQLNLPNLNLLRDDKYQKYNNLFVFFTVLIMIDEIMICLFNKYELLQLTF